MELLYYGGTNGNRIANSTLFVLNTFQDRTTLNEFIKKFSNKSIFYQDENDIIEWQLRYNSRRNIVANDKAENSNAIINLNIPNNPELNNSVLMSVDINTDPRNTSPRFVINDLDDYVKNATPVFIELENGSSLPVIVVGILKQFLEYTTSDIIFAD